MCAFVRKKELGMYGFSEGCPGLKAKGQSDGCRQRKMETEEEVINRFKFFVGCYL